MDICKIPRSFWSALSSHGLQASSILRTAHLPTTSFADVERVYTTEQYFSIFRSLEALAPNPRTFALTFVRSVETAIHPPSALIAFYARSFRDALGRLAQYQRLCTPATLNVVEQDGRATISNSWHDTTLDVPLLTVDLFITFTLELARRGTGQHIVPIRVELTRSELLDPSVRDFLSCPIQYNASADTIIFAAADLDAPFPGYSPEMITILEPALASSVSDIDAFDSVVDELKHVLKRQFRSGNVELAEIAKILGTSERSLQRRLNLEGTTFREVLANARREYCREMLTSTEYGLEDVARRLGYQEPTSFYRAFREWEGMSPKKWKKHHAQDRLTNAE